MQFDSDDIRDLRRFTGDRFTTKNGYDFRKKLSPGRVRTVYRYLDKIRELTTLSHAVVRPKKGEKKDLLAYTNQTGYPGFDVAIIQTRKGSRPKVKFDRTAPPGYRVSIDYPSLKQRETKIIKGHILYYVMNDDFDGFVEFIDSQAPGARLFVINTEGGSMWQKVAGSSHTVAEFVFELSEKYGSQFFSNNNYSYFDNWIESISCYTNYNKAVEYVAENARRREETKAKFTRLGMPYNLRYSDKVDGWFETENGELLGLYSRSTMENALKKAWDKVGPKVRKKRRGKKTQRQRIKGR